MATFPTAPNNNSIVNTLNNNQFNKPMETRQFNPAQSRRKAQKDELDIQKNALSNQKAQRGENAVAKFKTALDSGKMDNMPGIDVVKAMGGDIGWEDAYKVFESTQGVDKTRLKQMRDQFVAIGEVMYSASQAQDPERYKQLLNSGLQVLAKTGIDPKVLRSLQGVSQQEAEKIAMGMTYPTQYINMQEADRGRTFKREERHGRQEFNSNQKRLYNVPASVKIAKEVQEYMDSYLDNNDIELRPDAYNRVAEEVELAMRNGISPSESASASMTAIMRDSPDAITKKQKEKGTTYQREQLFDRAIDTIVSNLNATGKVIPSNAFLPLIQTAREKMNSGTNPVDAVNEVFGEYLNPAEPEPVPEPVQPPPQPQPNAPLQSPLPQPQPEQPVQSPPNPISKLPQPIDKPASNNSKERNRSNNLYRAASDFIKARQADYMDDPDLAQAKRFIKNRFITTKQLWEAMGTYESHHPESAGQPTEIILRNVLNIMMNNENASNSRTKDNNGNDDDDGDDDSELKKKLDDFLGSL